MYTPLDPFGEGALPVGIKTVRYVEYTTLRLERDSVSAEGLARGELGRLVTEELEVTGGELLSTSYEGTLEGDVYVLVCHARCRENIALPKRIEVDITYSK